MGTWPPATGPRPAMGTRPPATGPPPVTGSRPARTGARAATGTRRPVTGAQPAARERRPVAGAWRNVAAMADGRHQADITPARIRFTLLLGVVLATLLATGCATIPSSGPVGSAPVPAPPGGSGVSGGGL